MQNELLAHSYLDVLVEVLFLLSLPHLFNGKAQFFSGALHQEEEGLDIQVTHHLHAQDFVEHLNGFYLDICAASDEPRGLVRQQHAHELCKPIHTHPTTVASPSRLSSVYMTLATVLACNWDLNSYICTEERLSWIHSAKCSKSSMEKRPSRCRSQTKRMPKWRKSKGQSQCGCTSSTSDSIKCFLPFSPTTRSNSSVMYSTMPGLSRPPQAFPINYKQLLLQDDCVMKGACYLPISRGDIVGLVGGWLFGVYNIQMSNLGLRNQLKPGEKAFKYEFTLEIMKFFVKVPLPCKLKFMWRRNAKSIETKNEIDMRPSPAAEITVNEKLSNCSTIIYNYDTHQFQPKESELIANMVFTGSPKKLASCPLDLRCILDPDNYRASCSKVFTVPMTLHIPSDQECRLTFRLSSIFKEEHIVASERSVGSNSLNMSGLSIPQDVRYYQKRYDVVPSKDNKDTQSVIGKDTHSVTSYNPNRYPSAKREREDSNSIRKFDYGYLAALKSNLTNNDNDGRSNKKSVDNKTELNEGTYNQRQLVDEQNKRSKAEAELAKNKVEIEELKRKMGEMAIDNIQLKERAGNKEEVICLNNRIYDLNNELRTARMQLQSVSQDLQRAENEVKAIRSQRTMLEGQLQKRQKRIEGLQTSYRSFEGTQNQNSQLKNQLQTARRQVEEIKRQAQDRERQLLTDKFKSQQEANSRLQGERRQSERIRSTAGNNEAAMARRFAEMEAQLREKMEELATKTRYIISAEREMEEYKTRLTQYEHEKVFMQKEIIKLKNEAADRNEKARNDTDQQRLETLKIQQSRLQELLSNAQFTIQERQKIIAKLEQQRSNAQAKSSKLLMQANEANKRIGEAQAQCRTFKDRTARLQQANNQLAAQSNRLREEIAHLREEAEKKMTSSASPEADMYFRQTLQLQVELKYANNQLQRLRGVEQQLEREKWRAQEEKKDRLSLQAEFQKVERELAGKNRALMIEVEKTKMMSEQMNELHYSHDLMREELEKSRSIIHNGQQQLTALETTLNHLQAIKTALQGENAQLAAEKQRLLTNNEEVRQLQLKVKELDERNAEKLVSLQASNRNLLLAHREAKDSQKLAEERLHSLSQREQQLAELQTRLREFESNRSHHEGELARIIQERRMVEKRMEVVMEEMHSMKKRYEEEKGRSVSFTRNEDMHRLRSMESELEKKEKAVSKLSKEKLQLQEENVKMNVQIMKLLSELEKYKSNSNPHSLKTITHSLK